MSIFRAYDIRGVYGETLGPQDALKISYVFASKLGNEGPIFVGRDNRRSSLPLSLSALAGVSAAGSDVVDIGMVPTPLLYFAVSSRSARGGIVVTASHNPIQYNGLKLVGERARPLTYERGISEIEKECRRAQMRLSPEVVGRVSTEDIVDEYVDFVARDVRVSGDVRVVFELGNGTTGPVMERLVNRLSLNACTINGKPDSSFPKGMVNPANQDTLAELTEAVRKEGADLGIGLDVDGDRIGVVTRNGRFVFGDFLLALLSREVLRANQGATILLDVRASRAVMGYISKMGGNVELTRVGHSYIANAMLDGDFPLGGELSGHIYFKDRYLGYDDGMYCAIRLIELLSGERENLEELLAGFDQTFVSPEIRVSAPEDVKFEIVKRMERKLASEGAKINTVDGIRVELPGGWFSVRASNTEPALVIRAEGYRQGELEAILNQVFDLISQARSVEEA